MLIPFSNLFFLTLTFNFRISDEAEHDIKNKGMVKKYGGGVGPEHLEMWLIKNTWPTPPFGTKMTDPPLKQG